MFVKANRKMTVIILQVYANKLNYIFAKYLDIITRFTYNSGSHDIVAQLARALLRACVVQTVTVLAGRGPSYPLLSMSTIYLVHCKFAL